MQRLLAFGLVTLLAMGATTCTQEGHEIDLSGQDVRLTILHTSDWHGRLLPYDMDVLLTDENLGLNPDQGPFGGVARLAYLMKRERANAGRTIWVDSGDCFQGAPIFNVFEGEVSYQAMSMMRPDGVVLGNHEFDNGLENLVDKAANFANFPLLAANYHYREPRDPNATSLGDIARPFTIVDRDGLRIGIIGLANFSSLSSIGFGDNSTDITPMDLIQSTQYYINILQPQVNLIIGVSHAGLDEDQEVIENTVGLDMIFGGHLHVVLDPPRIIHDAAGREVVLAHSGAFLKYLGRMDVVLRARPDAPNDFEVLSHRYETIPIDSLVPEDSEMLRMLEPYAAELRRQIDLTRVLGFAPRRIRRFGTGGGDSPLGNFVADAIRTRRRVETDFAVNNSLGIRSDIVQGPIVVDQMYNIFPFPNTITTMTLSGNEIQEMLNFNARRSAGRGCATQLQISGVTMVVDCSVYPAVARDIRIGGELIQANRFYTMATNNYLAGGGSGFRVLRYNSTQQDTGISIRDAVMDAIQSEPSCLERCQFDGLDQDNCPLLQRCREDQARYDIRFCDGLSAFSEADWCLDELAPDCLEEAEVSVYQICLEYADPMCGDLYAAADREACYAASADACAGEVDVSPRTACAEAAGAGSCLALPNVSEFDTCVDTARRNAESLCITIPCMDARSDGRITRVLPTNEFVPTDDEDFSGEDAAALMESLQSSVHNDEACF